MRSPDDIIHNGKTLTEILRLHKLWIDGQEGGAMADLSEANLSGADLRWANLRGANLLCFGNMREIRTMQIDTWEIGYTADTLQIGCQRHAISKWRKAWGGGEAGREWISSMEQKAPDWADKNLSIVLTIIDANPATPTGHEVKE